MMMKSLEWKLVAIMLTLLVVGVTTTERGCGVTHGVKPIPVQQQRNHRRGDVLWRALRVIDEYSRRGSTLGGRQLQLPALSKYLGQHARRSGKRV